MIFTEFRKVELVKVYRIRATSKDERKARYLYRDITSQIDTLVVFSRQENSYEVYGTKNGVRVELLDDSQKSKDFYYEDFDEDSILDSSNESIKAVRHYYIEYE